MTMVREVGDVVRLTTPYGLDGTRNRCPACTRFLPSGPSPVCRSCGIVYRAFTEGGDFQVIHIGQV